jgi:hypothetical protein
MKNEPSTNSPKGTLTEKQLRFVEEYLIDCNATAAYKRAGYKVTSDAAAQAAASRLLTNLKVAEAIKAGQKASSTRTEITIDRIVQETWAHYLRCVAAEEFAAANKPLELLGRHVGAFPNKHLIAGVKGEPIRFIRFARAKRRPESSPAAV